MYLDFKDLEGYTVDEVTTVDKIIDNVIKLNNDDVFIAEEYVEDIAYEDDDVVIFKTLIDKYSRMRNIDELKRLKNSPYIDSTSIDDLNKMIEKDEEAIQQYGDEVIELYMLLINDELYEVDKKF